jgi:O-antigen/teichoic acid export membrane protein
LVSGAGSNLYRFLFSQMSLPRNLVSNFAANGYSQAVNVIVQFFSVPLFIKYWGVSRYGEWLVITAVPTYFALAEAGFGTVATNELAMSSARHDRLAALRTLHSLWGFLLMLCGSLFVAMGVLAYCLPWESILCLSSRAGGEVSWVVFLLGLYTLLNLLANSLNAQYRMADSYARGLSAQTTLRLVDFGVTCVVLIFGGGMVVLSATLVVSRLLGQLVLLIDVSRLGKDARLGLTYCEMSEIKRLLRPSLAFMAFPVGNAVYFQGITLAVNATLGTSAVVAFNATRTLTRIISQAVMILKHSTWPEFSRLLGCGDIVSARKLNRAAFGIAFWATLILSILLILIGPWLMKIWTHGAIVLDRNVLLVYLLGVVCNGIWFVGSAVLMAVNKHEGLAVRYILSTVIGVLIAYFLAGSIGLYAAPLGMLTAELLILPYAVNASCLVLGDRVVGLAKDVAKLSSVFALNLRSRIG